MRIILILLLNLCFLIPLSSAQQPMVLVKNGSYVPLYGSADRKPVAVNAFMMDVYPVTNTDFVEFLRKNPNFTRSNVKKIFAKESYLNHWTGDYDFGKLQAQAAVTNISWYVAKKYCECQGKRLPTMDEWEYAAMADKQTKDARAKNSYNQYILSWYERPKTFENKVGSTFKNYWGIYDLHGLVWEWTSDFNSILLTGESRMDKGSDQNLFCGGASINASDLMDYAAFMRYAFRASMKAQFTSKNLGFRCAQTIP